jgi:hypothetical protein
VLLDEEESAGDAEETPVSKAPEEVKGALRSVLNVGDAEFTNYPH